MADAEERFLKARLEREAARTSKCKDEAAEEAAKARAAFHEEVKALEASIATLIAAKKLDEASEQCRTLQQRITAANEVLALPSHEQRTLNSLLSATTAKINDAKTEQKPAKKFGFSSKAKLVATATATASAESVDAAGSTAAASSSAAAADPAKEDSASGVVYADLANQTLFVPPAKAVFLRRCTGCTVYALPTAGSLFLSDSSDCTVYCAPHQLRIKSCVDISLYTWCTSRPVIESCDRMRFGGYTAWRGLLASVVPADISAAEGGRLPSHAAWVEGVGAFKDLTWAVNSYTQVDDFHWLRQAQSPHWALIPEAEWAASDVVFETPTPPTTQ